MKSKKLKKMVEKGKEISKYDSYTKKLEEENGLLQDRIARVEWTYKKMRRNYRQIVIMLGDIQEYIENEDIK